MKFARDGKIFAINTSQLPNISIKHLANFGNVSFCTFFQYTNTYCGMHILSLLVESYKFNLSNNICKRTIQPSRKMYRTSHFINEVVVLLLSTYCRNRYFTQIACLFKRWKYISNKKKSSRFDAQMHWEIVSNFYFFGIMTSKWMYLKTIVKYLK